MDNLFRETDPKLQIYPNLQITFYQRNPLCFPINLLQLDLMSITYRPNKRKRNRTHGFIKRSRTPGGRRVLKSRRQKGRKKVSV